MVQSRSFQQSAPITTSTNVSSSSSSSSKNLPKVSISFLHFLHIYFFIFFLLLITAVKNGYHNRILCDNHFPNLPSQVMIPLSSIPTYSASMDSSSFLKTSFSKFPYPTKAELCYLTVVTKFPEEQIKIWFTAQRLKQGISWSPEEIEEARRKMFNTIIQTAPSNSLQSHHGTTQHTITVLPASLGAAGIPHILQGSLVSQGGVIVTQPLMANGIQVSNAPVALAVTPKPQAAARPMMQAKPVAALVADKGISMVVSTVGSSSTGSNVISSSNSSRSGGRNNNSIISSTTSRSSSNIGIGSNSVINLSLGSSNHSNTNTKVSSVNGKHNSANADPSDKSKGNVTSCLNATKGSSDNKNTDISKVKNTSTGDDSSTTDGKHNGSVEQKSSSNKNDSSSTGTDAPTDLKSTTSDSPTMKAEESSSPASKSSSPSPGAPPSSFRTLSNSFLDPSFYKGKKSQEQLSALKDSFLANQFPDQEEVDRLISLTGLTVREVRKWFSDRRYHFRNLKSVRSSTGGQSKSGTAAVAGSGSASSSNPVDLSESSSSPGAKTPQHNSAPLSPPATQTTHTPTSPTTPSRRTPRAPSPDFTAIRYKEREPHQVRPLSW